MPPFWRWFRLNVGRPFHVSAAGLALFGLDRRMLAVLIENENSEESRRDILHSLVCLLGRKVVPEYGVLV
jgi:hypothetical protein